MARASAGAVRQSIGLIFVSCTVATVCIDAALTALRADKPDPSECKRSLAEMITTMDQSSGKGWRDRGEKEVRHACIGG